MAWPKGKPRPAGAGRKVGTPNKFNNATVNEILDSMGFNPIVGMVMLAQEPKSPPAVRQRCMEALAKKRYPDLRSVEHSGPGGGAIQHALTVDWTKLTDEQLLKAKELADALCPPTSTP